MIELELDDLGSGHTHVVRCEAVLLDMDGTLVDSGGCVELTWRAWAGRHGIDPEQVMAIAHGRQNFETVRAVAPHLDLPEEYAAMVRAEEECHEGIKPVPGARELVAALPAIRWAVVTSAWRRLAEIRMGLAAVPLPSPAALITSDDTTRSKPDPQGYLLAAARVGVEPAVCVVIEDAPAGLQAGRAAGMRVIGVTTNFRREQLDADWHVADLRGVRVHVPSDWARSHRG